MAWELYDRKGTFMYYDDGMDAKLGILGNIKSGMVSWHIRGVLVLWDGWTDGMGYLFVFDGPVICMAG
jgi:hypothetical protein